MANSIELAQKFLPLIDSIYAAASKTAVLDAQTKVDFTGTNTVKILKVSTTGLGDYNRETGYPAGDVTATWEALQLTEERGKEISVDRMDDEETLGQAFGAVSGEFVRNHVVPELDAYRFAKYASAAGIGSAAADFTAGTDVLKAIDTGCQAMDDADVPDGGRVLFVSSALKPMLNEAVNRTWASEGGISRVLSSYNDMPVIYVPQKRFYSAITLNPGTAAWGYAKGESAANINFMIVEKGAVLQALKHAMPKIFDPDTNQKKDAWLFQYRLYHDAFVYENKAAGIYLHKATV